MSTVSTTELRLILDRLELLAASAGNPKQKALDFIDGICSTLNERGIYIFKLHRISLRRLIGQYEVKASLDEITRTVAYLTIDKTNLTITSAFEYYSRDYFSNREKKILIIDLNNLSESTDKLNHFLSECARISDIVKNR